MNKDPFEEYIKESEPDKWDKGYAWHTAIGLQAVDGLRTSEYLVRIAVRNIEGEISFDETNALLQSYYEEKRPTRFRQGLQLYCPSEHLVLRPMSIFPFTGSCLLAFILMQDISVIITLQRRNGC